MTTRTLTTNKLRAGDRIHLHGAVIKLEGRPRTELRGRQTWFTWQNMAVVSGRIDGLPTARLWTVQGDTMCFWRVER